MKENFCAREELGNISEQRNPEWYTALFEKRFSQLKPYSDHKNLIEELSADLRGIDRLTVPDKLTSAILWKNQDQFEILISDHDQSGYRMTDHNQILKEFSILYDSFVTYSSIIISSNQERYLLTNCLFFPRIQHLPELEQMLKRYKISKAFNLKPASYNYEIDFDPENGIGLDISTYDSLVFNDWTSQIAERYGLTVFEYMRFRLGQGLPEEKRHREFSARQQPKL